jgi:hypothetical protein
MDVARKAMVAATLDVDGDLNLKIFFSLFGIDTQAK